MNNPAPEGLTRSNLCAIAVLALLGVCATTALYLFERGVALQGLHERFLRDASLRAVLVTRMIDDHRMALDILGRFYDASQNVKRAQFNVFTEALFSQRAGIHGFAWHPFVRDADRARFEAQARRDGVSDFQFREYNTKRRLIPAQRRAVHYPVFFLNIHRSGGLQRALGLDLASIPERLALLEKARVTGRAVATASIPTVVLPPTDRGVLVFLPVYEKNSRPGTSARALNLQGFLSVILLTSQVMEAAVQATPVMGLATELIDLSAAPEQRLLSRWNPRTDSVPPPTELSPYVQTFPFADRQWQLRITPTSAYLNRHLSMAYRWIPAIGLMLTAMLTALFAFLLAGRERAERLWLLRETMLQAISANIPGVVYQFYARPEKEYGLYYVSPRSDDLFGISHADPDYFHSFAAKLDERDRQAFLSSVDEAVKTVAPWNFEARLHRTPGETLWVKGQSLPERRAGEVVFNGVLYDITNFKQTEEALRESEAKFAKIFQSSPDAIVIARRSDGRIIDINDACVQIIGYSREEAIGLQYLARDLWARPEDRVKINAILEKKGACTNFDTQFKTRDGRVVEALFSARIFELKGEEYIISIARDMTAQHQLENQLIHSQRMESIGRLAGGVAHDFNNLLTPIIGYAEIMLRDLNSQDHLYEHISQIHRAAENAKHLTRQLLAFSRKQVLEMKPVNLNQVIIGFQKILRRTIREDITITLRMAQDLAIIEADESQLEQILMNLAVNAQDAIAGSGTITIATANETLGQGLTTEQLGIMPGPYVALTFSDTGSGMDQESMEHLFEPFYTTKMKGKGTGLGLSTIYGIVTQHRGGIGVQSKVGEGTTFKIYLPCVQAPDQQLMLERAALATQGGSETVLVVEDNDAVRTLAVQILTSQGYQVLDAGDPNQALTLMEAGPSTVALVLTDIVMPSMNGRELFERLRGINPGLKVLYMSGYSEDVIAHHGVLDEGVDFIHKPFSVQGLLEKVRAVLDQGATFKSTS